MARWREWDGPRWTRGPATPPQVTNPVTVTGFVTSALRALGRLAAAALLVAAVRAGLGPRLAARERQPQDRPVHAAELPVQRAGVVRQVVLLADLAHARGDLAVARARHVRVQVVLDLVAEVARQDV